MLRHVLTAHSSASYSLAAQSHALLGRPLEVLPSSAIARLWPHPADAAAAASRHDGAAPPPQSAAAVAAAATAPDGGPSRVAVYALTIARRVSELLRRCATIEDAVAIGRLTGLTLPQA